MTQKAPSVLLSCFVPMILTAHLLGSALHPSRDAHGQFVQQEANKPVERNFSGQWERYNAGSPHILSSPPYIVLRQTGTTVEGAFPKDYGGYKIAGTVEKTDLGLRMTGTFFDSPTTKDGGTCKLNLYFEDGQDTIRGGADSARGHSSWFWRRVRGSGPTGPALSAVDCLSLFAGRPRAVLPTDAEPDLGTLHYLSTSGTAIQGVAADGVSLVLLRYVTTKPGKILFRVLSDMGRLYPLVGDPFRSAGEGQLEVQTRDVLESLQVAFALYRPPSFLSCSDVTSRSVTVEMGFTPEGKTLADQKAECTLDLVRPPIVLVHGTYDNPKYCYEDIDAIDGTPMNLAPRLRAAGFPDVSCLDWEETNGMKDPSDFETNQKTVWTGKNGIQQALQALRKRHIAVTQADVVCHSQGGVIARVYARGFGLRTSMAPDHPHYHDPARCQTLGCWYHRADNYCLGDIHRLITISATHRGSHVCNIFRALADYPDKGIKAKFEKLTTEIFLVGVDQGVSGITTGGFLDQTPRSLELQLIGPTPLPAHALACIAENEDMRDVRPDGAALANIGSVLGYGNYWNKLFKVWVGTKDVAKEFSFDRLAAIAKENGVENMDKEVAKYKVLNATLESHGKLFEKEWFAATIEIDMPAVLKALQLLRPRVRQDLDAVIFQMRNIVFEGDFNDCTVARNSSLGGLAEKYTTTVPNVLHGWAPRSKVVQDRVIELLGNDGSLFDRDGFPGAYSKIKSRASQFTVDPGGNVGPVTSAFQQVPLPVAEAPAKAQKPPDGATQAAADKPAAQPWSGSWDTALSWGAEPVVITQTGNQVTGSYQAGKATMRGTVDGKVLKFTYNDARFAQKGRGELVLSDDGSSWKGQYFVDDDPDTIPFHIEAKRVK